MSDVEMTSDQMEHAAFWIVEYTERQDTSRYICGPYGPPYDLLGQHIHLALSRRFGFPSLPLGDPEE